jgi:transcriptional regulator with XRE-family HTH domain
MQYNKIGNYIKRKRINLGVSLNSFSVENEIEPSTLSRIENSKLELKISVLEKIANGFNQTPSEFLLEFEKEN